MKRRVLFAFVMLFIAVTNIKAQDSCKIELLPLKDVSITLGEFRDVQELNHNYIISLSVKKLVAGFKIGAGLKSKIKPYPIHEIVAKSDNYGSLNGEMVGSYLTASARMYETTLDNLMLDSVNIVLEELKKCQEAGKNGTPILAPLPMRGIWEVITNPNEELSAEQRVLAKETFFTAQKLMTGLYDIYKVGKNELAKEILITYANALKSDVLSKVSENHMEQCFDLGMGMLSLPYIQLYDLTSNAEYLQFAQDLIEKSTLVTVDSLAGHDVKLIVADMAGAALLCRYAQDSTYQSMVIARWHDIVDNYSRITGGIGVNGKFVHKSELLNYVDDLRGSELCNALDFMQLTKTLYENCADSKMVAYYEKAFYNQAYAAYELDGGMVAYYSSLRPGHYKKYAAAYETVSCCAQAAYEFASQFAQSVYSHTDSALYVNMFVPSSMWWEEMGISLMQQTKFPMQGRTTLFITDAPGKEFPIYLRHADWSLSDVSNAFINGVRYKLEPNADGYVVLRHAWKEGDVITLNLTQQLDVNFIGPNSEYVAFSYGPVLLGVDIGHYGLYYDDFFGTNKMEPSEKISVESNVPMFYVEPSLIKKGVTRIADDKLRFSIGTSVITEKVEIEPWYDIRFTRSSVLFRRYDSLEKADEVRARAAVTTN